MFERLTSLFDERALEPELLQLIDGTATGVVVTVVALATAFGIGVVHAIGPGHGKALVGAYLASTRGRRRDAVALGALIAAMHTASVVALGVVLQLTRRVPGFTWLEPLLVLVSAAAVSAVGVVLVRRQLAARRSRADVPVGESPVLQSAGSQAGGLAGHDQPQHGHHHLGHDDHHHALPDGVAPLSRAGVVALATSGGLVPSPAAFLVLATAMAIGRTGFGLGLVAAFGAGLAATLTGVGLLVLWGRDRVEGAVDRRGPVRWLRTTAPLVTAWIVLLGGVLLGLSASVRLLP